MTRMPERSGETMATTRTAAAITTTTKASQQANKSTCHLICLTELKESDSNEDSMAARANHKTKAELCRGDAEKRCLYLLRIYLNCQHSRCGNLSAAHTHSRTLPAAYSHAFQKALVPLALLAAFPARRFPPWPAAIVLQFLFCCRFLNECCVISVKRVIKRTKQTAIQHTHAVQMLESLDV